MAGLTDKASGDLVTPTDRIDQAQQAWQTSMVRRLDLLREELRNRTPEIIAGHCGGAFDPGGLHLHYWSREILVSWPSLEAQQKDSGIPCSTFDTAMLLYYLHTADGAPMADRWIGFRELPDGSFYNQAFQGYSGDKIANIFGEDPDAFDLTASSLDGMRLSGIAPHAYAFLPLPRVRLAVALWPGDEDFTARASILFDAAAPHYMTTDGLALLGAGLAGRFLAAVRPGKPPHDE